MPRGRRKTIQDGVMVGAIIPAALRDEIHRRAASHHVTVSAEIRRLLIDAVGTPEEHRAPDNRKDSTMTTTANTSLEGLSREMADEYGIDLAAARADVKAFAGQISDTADLYDIDDDTLTESRVDLVRAQMGTVYGGES